MSVGRGRRFRGTRSINPRVSGVPPPRSGGSSADARRRSVSRCTGLLRPDRKEDTLRVERSLRSASSPVESTSREHLLNTSCGQLLVIDQEPVTPHKVHTRPLRRQIASTGPVSDGNWSLHLEWRTAADPGDCSFASGAWTPVPELVLSRITFRPPDPTPTRGSDVGPW